MAQELHVTRAERWIEAQAFPIDEAAWAAVVAADPTLVVQQDEYCDYRDLATRALRRVHAVLWTGHPVEPPSLWLMNGEITCKDADDDTLAKLREIAALLGARVLADDGTEY
jgi:hypothetical protein